MRPPSSMCDTANTVAAESATGDDAAVADLSLVIPCLNAAALLPRQLEALSAEQWDGIWDIVVVDNGSTDATKAVARSYEQRLPRLRVIDASERRGRQHACNAGARVAGNAIAFVDADDEIAPGFVAAIGDALAEHDIVAARIDDATLNEEWVLEGRSSAQSAALQHSLGFLPFGSGGTLGVRREVFEQLGGFAYDMHYAEDIDFCWRAQLSGHPILFVPDAAIRYRYRPTLRSMFAQHRNFGRASARLYRRYRERGMPGRTNTEAVVEWWGMIKALLLMRTRADAARWSRRFGRSVGRLEGSCHFRVWYL